MRRERGGRECWSLTPRPPIGPAATPTSPPARFEPRTRDFRKPPPCSTTPTARGSPGRRESRLGEQWRAAKVRGTPYNRGRALDLLLETGAAPYGNWPGCHATQW